jgi:tripartite-type tricarboxylate transporter receptor subunit TctC
MRRFGLSWLSAMVLMSMGSVAAAEDYPNQTIRMISGLQTGSSGDVAGRMLALKMTAALGHPVVLQAPPP